MSFNQLAERFSEASMETFDTSFVRHNINTEAGQQALKLYETAVGLMKQRSADNAGDPLGWNYQAGKLTLADRQEICGFGITGCLTNNFL